MRLALVQTTLTWHSPAHNRAHFEELIEDVNGQADLIVLPEMFTTGFTEDVSVAEVFKTDTARWMQMTAERLQACLVGSVMVSDRGKIYNRCLVARPGQALVWYDKAHLFGLGGEQELFTAGTSRIVFEYLGWRICPLVCYDLRFPVFSRNTPLNYDLLLYVANWPARRAAAWNALLPARAVENLAYCAGVNSIGMDGHGEPYAGDSQAISYDGTTLLNLGSKNETGLVTLSYESLAKHRETFPAWKDADLFDIRLPTTH